MEAGYRHPDLQLVSVTSLRDSPSTSARSATVAADATLAGSSAPDLRGRSASPVASASVDRAISAAVASSASAVVSAASAHAVGTAVWLRVRGCHIIFSVIWVCDAEIASLQNSTAGNPVAARVQCVRIRRWPLIVCGRRRGTLAVSHTRPRCRPLRAPQ